MPGCLAFILVAATSPTGGQASGGAVVSTLVWAGVLIGLAVLAGIGLLAYRRRVFRDESPSDATGGLLDDLRQAVREGRMTPEEFDAAKHAMAMRLRGEAPLREIPKHPLSKPMPKPAIKPGSAPAPGSAEGSSPKPNENPGRTHEGPGPEKGGSRPGM